MRRGFLIAAAIAAAVGLSALAQADQWFDNFDSYQKGSQMHGQGGWKGWDNDPQFGALVSDAQSRSRPHSVDIRGLSDLVHEYPDEEKGKWTFTAWQYIPSSTTGTSYFILLNRYRDGGSQNYDRWSIQLPFDMARNEVRDDFVQGARLPIVRDQWMEIRVEIDLDTDYREVYYGGQFLSKHTWTRGESGSALNIDAVDLFANNATSVYYDDLSLVPEPVSTLLLVLGAALALRRR
jgi:opacity protein-like surface antigen